MLVIVVYDQEIVLQVVYNFGHVFSKRLNPAGVHQSCHTHFNPFVQIN